MGPGVNLIVPADFFALLVTGKSIELHQVNLFHLPFMSAKPIISGF